MTAQSLRTGFALIACAAMLCCERESEREPAMQPASGTVQRGPQPAHLHEGPPAAPTEVSPSLLPGTSGMTAPSERSPAEASVGEPIASKPTQARVVVEIVTARCDLEAACGRISPSSTYASFSDCERELMAHTSSYFGSAECTSGVERALLDDCRKQVRMQNCTPPLESLDRVPACLPSTLCAH